MEFKQVKELLNNSEYWKSFIHPIGNYGYLTTEFTVDKMGVRTEFCNPSDDFNIGEFVIVTSYRGTNCASENNLILFDLWYKQLKYSNTLYIDYHVKGKTYTKPVRMKKNETLHDRKIQDKIKSIVYEAMNLYMINAALENYSIDNIRYLDLEKREIRRKMQLKEEMK